MEWIEINLPWSVFGSFPLPEYPREIILDIVKERFGKSREELEKEFTKTWGERPWKCYFDQNHPAMAEVLKFDEKTKEIEEFTKTLPEFVSWDIERNNVEKQRAEFYSKNCFAAFLH